MSLDALGWARKQRLFLRPGKRDVVAGAVLRELAGYADADDRAWPKVTTLVSVTGYTPRAVQDALRRLEAAGIIRKTGDKVPQNRNIPIYQVETTGSFDGWVIGEMGAGDAPFAEMGAGSAPPRVQGVHPKGAGSAPPIGMVTEPEEAEASSTRADKSDRRSAYERARAAYPEAGLISPALDRRAWARAIRRCDPELLIEAIQVAARSPKGVGASGVPCAFHRFLDEDRFELFLARGGAGEPASRTRFAGPADLRAKFLREHGDGPTGSYLDPCDWREPGELVARTRFGADRLRELLRDHDWAEGLKVTVRPAQPASVN